MNHLPEEKAQKAVEPVLQHTPTHSSPWLYAVLLLNILSTGESFTIIFLNSITYRNRILLICTSPSKLLQFVSKSTEPCQVKLLND